LDHVRERFCHFQLIERGQERSGEQVAAVLDRAGCAAAQDVF
jgi:hypothetical protein